MVSISKLHETPLKMAPLGRMRAENTASLQGSVLSLLSWDTWLIFDLKKSLNVPLTSDMVGWQMPTSGLVY